MVSQTDMKEDHQVTVGSVEHTIQTRRRARGSTTLSRRKKGHRPGGSRRQTTGSLDRWPKEESKGVVATGRAGGPRLKFAGDEENFMRGKKEVVAGAQKFGISVARGPCWVLYREDATGGQRRNGRVEYGASVRLHKSERGTEHVSFRGVDGRRA